MPAITFAAPILPGKTEKWKETISEMFGSRKSETDEFLKRGGIVKEVVCLQQTPMGDFAVIYLEGENPANINESIMASDHPYEKWFVQSVMVELHGMNTSLEAPPANEVIVDWHA